MAEPDSAIQRANRLVGDYIGRTHPDAQKLFRDLGTPVTVTVTYANGRRYQSLTFGGADG